MLQLKNTFKKRVGHTVLFLYTLSDLRLFYPIIVNAMWILFCSSKEGFCFHVLGISVGWTQIAVGQTSILFVWLSCCYCLFFTFNLHMHGSEVRPEIWILYIHRIWGFFSVAIQRFEISNLLTSVSSPFPFKHIQWLSYFRCWIIGFVLFCWLPFFSPSSRLSIWFFLSLFLCWDLLCFRLFQSFSFISLIKEIPMRYFDF